MVSMTEDLEDGDRIFNIAEVGIDAQVVAELQPNFPMSILLVGVARNDRRSHRRLDSAKVSAECVAGRK